MKGASHHISLKQLKTQKVKGHALQLTIIIALVIAIFSSALILLGFYTKAWYQKWERRQQLEDNAISGINLLRSKHDLALNTHENLDLYSEGNDSVLLSRKSWGLLNVLSAHAFHQQENCRKTLLTTFRPTIEEYALYLADHNQELTLTGECKIKGPLFIPEKGIERGYSEGETFKGEWVKGSTQRSGKRLPFHFEKTFADLEAVVANAYISKDLPDSLNQSFNDSTLLFEAPNFNLSNVQLSGNIIIYADKAITVRSNAILQDIILFAPRVIIESGFSGSLQLYATESLEIQEDAHLHYPSIAGIFKKETSADPSIVHIGAGGSVEGTVFAAQFIQDKSGVLVQLERGSQVTGDVYSQKSIEAKGSVLGRVTCHYFQLQTRSAMYKNTLMDTQIDYTGLPETFVPILPCDKPKDAPEKAIKWIE